MVRCPACGKNNPEGFSFCGFCGAPLSVPPGAGEQRKTVTVLFCDIVGSTRLSESTDPETLRALLGGYFERMRRIVERHGGVVEKFIGDAVMAVFGVPHVHEDDALRACRAAVEMRRALPELGVEGRIGVATGEVVTGTEERLATGDTVNVAARLQQAASPGEVLMGEGTHAVARRGVEAEAVAPLQLRGKAEAVPAYRLLAVREAPQRDHRLGFVGRPLEVAMLRSVWGRTLAERRCELATIVGEAGVGKSRLAAEALSSMEDVRVVRGHCLPYGEGITYWPVVEVITQLDVLPSDPTATAAITSLVGQTGAGTTAEEIAWSFRKLLEEAAPVICVFEDVHWGEEAFLDLVEHAALLSSGSPILLLTLARPDLVERRPAWPVAVRLKPLIERDVDELIGERVPAALGRRIARAAGGNPLFVSEMLAMAEQSEGEVAVPPTLQALLAARLDQLMPAERRVLEYGAVEGEVFHRGAVQAVAPTGTPVTPRLAALVRKELIRPDRAQVPGEDGFRFCHLLLRDAAYEGLPKSARAQLHVRFAAWLEAHVTAVGELDEILGYHLERACRYRTELGMPEDRAVAARARKRLTDSGRRALLRQDFAAAANLFERASALGGGDPMDIELEFDRVDAVFLAGRGDDAKRIASAAAERAAAAGDSVAELVARIKLSLVRLSVDPEGAAEELSMSGTRALPVFEAAEDDFALHVAYLALGEAAHQLGRMDEERDAKERALAHARRTGLTHYEAAILPSLATARLRGTTPVGELLEWLDVQEATGMRHWSQRQLRSAALAQQGRLEEARTILSNLRAELADRGAAFPFALTTAQSAVELELMAGDPAQAVDYGQEGCRLLEQAGERSWLSTAAGMLAQALYACERLDEADAWAERAHELGASDDALTQLLWRQVRAKVHARRDDAPVAVQLANEAISICGRTDMLNAQADAYSDLAEVLAASGDVDGASTALEQALARYERKGNVVSADTARRRHADLRRSARAAQRT